jgi:hypothetical protein
MSRAQQSGVLATANANQATNETNAQNQFSATQGAIGNYGNQLAKFVSGNPYTQGGEYDQTINTGLANTSDAGSNSLKGALQAQAKLTGQNSAADAATAASNAQQNTRNLSADQAQAQQQRISSQAGYNQTALGASSTPIQANQALYGTASGAAQGDLSTAASMAATPGFWDEVGNSIASVPGNFAEGAGQGVGKAALGCWIASEIFGGWYEPRTVLVREWLNVEYAKTFPGNVVMVLYRAIGREVAWLAHRFPPLKWALTPLFNKALSRAERWK